MDAPEFMVPRSDTVDRQLEKPPGQPMTRRWRSSGETQHQLESATAFVAEAERMANERDVDGILTVFAEDSRQTITLDGLVVECNGLEEIHQAWAGTCAFMDARRVFVQKSLVLAGDATIVNEWTGEIAGRANVRGIEVWQFNDSGRVSNQRLYGFMDARPEASPVQKVRMVLAHPLTAAAFARVGIGR